MRDDTKLEFTAAAGWQSNEARLEDKMNEGLKLEYLPAPSQWAQKLLLPACELAAPIGTTLTNQPPQTELQPYTESEMAEMTFAFRIRLNCQVEEIYAHAMGVKL